MKITFSVVCIVLGVVSLTNVAGDYIAVSEHVRCLLGGMLIGYGFGIYREQWNCA